MLRSLFLSFALMTCELSVGPVRAQDLCGTGSTVAGTLYQKWFQEYKAKTGVTVVFEDIGSSVGPKNVTAHAVDFGASDAPLSDDATRAAPGLRHVPTVAHLVVFTYNLPGIGAGLRLTGPVVAGIYLGEITRWNGPEIVRLNPGLPLPDLAISPVHPSSGGGTTSVLTAYLSAVSPAWKDRVGAGKSVHWPVGLGGRSDVRMAAAVRAVAGSIGPLEWDYALTNAMPCAAMENARGNFVYPSVGTAAATAASLPPDLRGADVKSNAPLNYPLVGFIYLLIYKGGAKPALKGLLTWILTEGQHDAAPMGYVPLPPGVREKALAVAASIR